MPVKVQEKPMIRTTDGTKGYVCPNTRDQNQPESDYKVKIAILMGNQRVNTFLPVHYGIRPGFGGYRTALTHESVKRFMTLIPEGKRIVKVEAKANADTEKGEYLQTEGSCSEAFADTLSMALYFRSRQIYITIGE